MIQGLFGSGLASRIDERLWQGGYPLDTGTVREKGFTAVILAAKELQPESAEDFALFDGLRLILAPLDDPGDAGPTGQEIPIATAAAEEALEELDRGGRVLTTCAEGRNRSSLINGLILIGRRGMSGREAADHIRASRRRTLTNSSFRKFLYGIPRP